MSISLPAGIYGFHQGVAYSDYAKIHALNYSTLKHMKRSPLSFRYNQDNPKPPTPAMLLGAGAHTAMLEPELISNLAVWNGARRIGKKYKAWLEEHAGRQQLTRKQYDVVAGMCSAIRDSKAAMRYLGGPGLTEVSVVWHDKASGRDCKGRFDRIVGSIERRHRDRMPNFAQRPVVADLKTCRDARPFLFGAQAYRLGYHIQLAMYQDGFYYLTGVLPEMKLIAIESAPPHEIVVYSIPDDVLLQGKEEHSALVKRLGECERSGKWPPELEDETELTLPTYAYSGDSDDDLSGLELVAE